MLGSMSPCQHLSPGPRPSWTMALSSTQQGWRGLGSGTCCPDTARAAHSVPALPSPQPLLPLQVCGEKNRFEKLMEYFRNEDSNIDFMVSVHKAGDSQPEDLQPPALGAAPMVHQASWLCLHIWGCPQCAMSPGAAGPSPGSQGLSDGCAVPRALCLRASMPFCACGPLSHHCVPRPMRSQGLLSSWLFPSFPRQ